MPSIRELMAGKVPGSMKVQYRSWEAWAYLVPYFSDGICWYGLDQDSDYIEVEGDGEWCYWEQPKEKVKRWLWADSTGSVTGSLYSEKEIEKKSFRESFSIKLEWSETEFPLLDEDLREDAKQRRKDLK